MEIKNQLKEMFQMQRTLNKNILDDMYNKLTQCGNSITGRYFR